MPERVSAPATGNMARMADGSQKLHGIAGATGQQTQAASLVRRRRPLVSEARQTRPGGDYLTSRRRGKATCEATQCPRSRPDRGETGTQHSRAFVVLDQRLFPTMRLLAPLGGEKGPVRRPLSALVRLARLTSSPSSVASLSSPRRHGAPPFYPPARCESRRGRRSRCDTEGRGGA